MGEQTKTRAGVTPGFLRRNAWVVVTAVLLALLAVTTAWTWGSQETALDQQTARIGELERGLVAAEAARAEVVQADVMTGLGISQGRLNKDARVISDLAGTVFTWDSGLAYEEARTQLKDRYQLAEDDAFLTGFMPPSRYNVDTEGERYYYIDAMGLNSSVEGEPDIEVVKAVVGEYTYAVMVDVRVSSDAIEQTGVTRDPVTAQRRMLIFLTVDAEGDVSGLPVSPPVARLASRGKSDCLSTRFLDRLRFVFE